jgi:hypothetical protein
LIVLIAWVIWRSYKAPNNWRIDAELGGIRFNHWKELILGALVLLALVGIFGSMLL